MATSIVVLPGDTVDNEQIPASAKRQLKLGPGLRHLPPSTIKATVGGTLSADAKKNALWVEYSGGRYIPSTGDLVIAIVHHSSADYYHCQITPHAPLAMLPQLAFEAATKKTRPQLSPGSLVYARVSSASKHFDTELECVRPDTGKADGLGPLKGGMVFDVSVSFARRLMQGKRGGVVALEELSQTLSFEVAIGRNGRIWVDGGDGGVAVTLAVGRAVVESDEANLDEGGQKALVKRLIRGLA